MSKRNFPIIYIFLFLSTILSIPYLSYAKQQTFPFLGEISSDKVNVRAGQSTNFEAIAQLNKGEEVVVLEQGYNWYKVVLPQSAKSYIHEKYIHPISEKRGGIVGDKVNVRAGPGTEFTILGQLLRGEEIYLLEKIKEWYRIYPVKGSFGWISEQFVKFKSNDANSYLKKNEQAAAALKNEGKPQASKAPQERTLSVIIGRISSRDINGKTSFFVKDDHQNNYSIIGLEDVLHKFNGYKVNIKGYIDNSKADPKTNLSILAIQEINMLL